MCTAIIDVETASDERTLNGQDSAKPICICDEVRDKCDKHVSALLRRAPIVETRPGDCKHYAYLVDISENSSCYAVKHSIGAEASGRDYLTGDECLMAWVLHCDVQSGCIIPWPDATVPMGVLITCRRGE
jgi:hypothetical protein